MRSVYLQISYFRLSHRKIINKIIVSTNTALADEFSTYMMLNAFGYHSVNAAAHQT